MIEDQPANQTIDGRIVLRNRRDEIEAVLKQLVDAATSRNLGDAACFGIRLALEEAVSNAFKHGNLDHEDKVVLVEYRVNDASFAVEIADEGAGFDPGAVPDPTEEENVEIPAGRGIVLMRAFMTRVEFLPPGNRVRMVYEKTDAQSSD